MTDADAAVVTEKIFQSEISEGSFYSMFIFQKLCMTFSSL